MKVRVVVSGEWRCCSIRDRPKITELSDNTKSTVRSRNQVYDVFRCDLCPKLETSAVVMDGLGSGLEHRDVVKGPLRTVSNGVRFGGDWPSETRGIRGRTSFRPLLHRDTGRTTFPHDLWQNYK